MTETQPLQPETPCRGLANTRPLLHYTARDTWLNDPNGLIYDKGTYHLFYQNNPYGNVWGNMSWGHATSTDLSTWVEHPVAILCSDEEDIFSGSIVIDHLNSSGLGSPGSSPWVAIYTSAFKEKSVHRGTQAQSLAFSTDQGMTWTRCSGNPVLTRGTANFRDPKVFWYSGSAGSYWVMVAVEALEQKVLLYKSRNLKDWDYLSDFGPANAAGGEWECPDLFCLPLDEDPATTKWVMTVNINPGAVAGGSGGQYFIGHFDGHRFTADNWDRGTAAQEKAEPKHDLRNYQWLDWGRDYYAAVSFGNVPDNRRIMIGWMNNWDYANDIPTSPWRSAMSLAREITLSTIEGCPALVQRPILPANRTPVGAYRQQAPVVIDGTSATFPDMASGPTLVIQAQFRAGTAHHFGLKLRDPGPLASGPAAQNGERFTAITYNADTGELAVDRTRSGSTGFHKLFPSIEKCPVRSQDGVVNLEIIVDACSVEVFAQGGEKVITDLIFPSGNTHIVEAFAEGGHATLEQLTITAYT
ncbi:glycoside hydrolase family 32 protein [Arthrobacter sp. MA-N2]|uniref:glycoside hydrolase family 32 protein n=1 Tax=Arthrobacter sp. MA-N2 TaxID=1101188 RepID=UPI00048A3186|nr:glycoside hydrolase family 32 protein [Arthrobacter sp. MA-N2]